MNISSKRLKNMGLERTQFQILCKIFLLWINSIPNNNKKYICIHKDKIKKIFHRSRNTFVSCLKILEQNGFIDYVPLKLGGHSKKVSEYMISVSEKSLNEIKKINIIQKKINKINQDLLQEFEDFEF